MNDEIKEILTNLEDIGFMYKRIAIEEIDKILDYITNLQQENEKIRKMNMHEHKYGSDMEEKYLIEKTKNDRAVEYIKQEEIKIIYKELGLQWCNAKDDLLNILNGKE